MRRGLPQSGGVKGLHFHGIPQKVTAVVEAGWREGADLDLPPPRYSLTVTVFTSVYCCNAYSPISLPMPDCLKPPKGAAASKTSKQFTQTVPALTLFAIAWALSMLRVHTAAARP